MDILHTGTILKKEPEPLLWHSNLISMTYNPNCGLVVDGMWGEQGLIFPLAAYEAKSGREWGSFAEQIHHACRTYLSMLDDLARNPDNVAEYQTKESSQFQLFAFTSSASYWTVDVAWSSSDECVSSVTSMTIGVGNTLIGKIEQMVKQIWKGDIRKYSNALQLLYIVDQIHDFAIKRHLPFVLKHLKAWYARDNQRPFIPHKYCGLPGYPSLSTIKPQWMNLEEESKRAKSARARETRKRKRPNDFIQDVAKRRRVTAEEDMPSKRLKAVATVRPRAISISSDSD
ncbi:hypothetical protein V8C35DRAFT_258074 [Trichoderma chlorosporum]